MPDTTMTEPRSVDAAGKLRPQALGPEATGAGMDGQRMTPADANLHLIAQGVELLAGLDPALYTATPPVPMGALGGHFRHCLEFYERFFEGLDSGEVDYDARRRDARVETDPAHARERFLAVAERLRALPAGSLDRALLAVHDCDDEDDAECGRSSVRRELLFLASHTTHHFALIAALLRLRGVEPGPDFGVAASTLAHRRRQAAAAGG